MNKIRLRQHTDGRVALITENFSVWNVYVGGDCFLKSEEYVSGPGWSELLVAELPEPATEPSGQQSWVSAVGRIVVEDGVLLVNRSPVGPIAAAAAANSVEPLCACEQYRAQRKATS